MRPTSGIKFVMDVVERVLKRYVRLPEGQTLDITALLKVLAEQPKVLVRCFKPAIVRLAPEATFKKTAKRKAKKPNGSPSKRVSSYAAMHVLIHVKCSKSQVLQEDMDLLMKRPNQAQTTTTTPMRIRPRWQANPVQPIQAP